MQAEKLIGFAEIIAQDLSCEIIGIDRNNG